jgi:glycosyltransferase involved in cell wall biosynthesis
MLSINIPVYNIEVYHLVLALLKQAKKLQIVFEIRVYDDGSNLNYKKLNSNLHDFAEVEYLEMDKNMGRAAIRNKMGFDSKYPLLLFIDADSELVNDNYLQQYLANKKPNTVLCGGTAYKNERPEKEKLLRWFYGKQREAISAEIRNQKKGFILTSNNFLIEKKTFESIHFREDIKKYGHEDTLLGFDLFCFGVQILHINNPVFHTGLESSIEFLAKTKTGLETLCQITHELLKDDKEFVEQVYFLHKFSQLKSIVPGFLLKSIYTIFGPFLERNLCGQKPRLFFFDLYKLGYYANIKKPHPEN